MNKIIEREQQQIGVYLLDSVLMIIESESLRSLFFVKGLEARHTNLAGPHCGNNSPSQGGFKPQKSNIFDFLHRGSFTLLLVGCIVVNRGKGSWYCIAYGVYSIELVCQKPLANLSILPPSQVDLYPIIILELSVWSADINRNRCQ